MTLCCSITPVVSTHPALLIAYLLTFTNCSKTVLQNKKITELPEAPVCLRWLKTLRQFCWLGGNWGTYTWFLFECHSHNNTAGGLSDVLAEWLTFPSSNRFAPSKVLLELMWCYRKEMDSWLHLTSLRVFFFFSHHLDIRGWSSLRAGNVTLQPVVLGLQLYYITLL